MSAETGKGGDSPDKKESKQQRAEGTESARMPDGRMGDFYEKEVPEQKQKQEKTAFDLTEKEREVLFKAAARLLKLRGRIIDPAEPNVTYINTEGKQYIPDSYLEAEISADELEPYNLPYDNVMFYSEEVEFGDEGPRLLALGTKRMVTRDIVLEEGQPASLAMGYETQSVTFVQEPSLGIVVEDEGGDVDLYPGEPDEEQVMHDADGNEIRLKGSSLIVDEAPPLSHSELIELTKVFAKI